MSNHKLILGKSHDLGLGQGHKLALGNDHSLGLGHAHDNGLGVGHSQDNNLTLGQSDTYDFGFHQADEHDLAFQQLHEHDHIHETELALDQNHSGSCDEHERPLELALSNHDLYLEDSHQFSVKSNHNFTVDRDVVLGAENGASSMAVLPTQEMPSSQSQLVTSPQIVQTRTLATDPSHELIVGQEFSDVLACRRALRNAAIALHFEIQTIKSDKNRLTAKCASDGCPWRIHAAKLLGVPTFTIRTFHDQHTCGGINHVGHQQASVEWVAKSMEARLHENPNYKPKEILEEIHRTHGITLSYKQAWRGKERIMQSVRGSFEEGYRLLPQYCDQVKRTNPGSIASVYGNPSDNCFQRLFISFHASVYGFVNACHPVIGLDCIRLKSKYLGTLLFASSFDGDGGIFPLAFGVVDEENDDNWMWFLSELHSLLEANTQNMPRLTILSDRQKGIVDGVEANFPTAFHGFCMHHLSKAFRRDFNDSALVNLLWEAAFALTKPEFEAKVSQIQEISPGAAYWIGRIHPHLWATAFFDGPRFGHMTANITESLNTWMSEASGLPVIQLMESIRRLLMTWYNERREISRQWSSLLVPSAERRVAESVENASNYQVFRADESKFQVVSPDGMSNMVDIRNRCCQCRGWQLYGLPCTHAVAALLSCRQNVHRFTERCFTVATYRKAYSQTIHPVPDKTLWSKSSENAQDGGMQVQTIINPPKFLQLPGRPRKKRTRAEDHGRPKRVVHCSRCNQTGHFRTTCPTTI